MGSSADKIHIAIIDEAYREEDQVSKKHDFDLILDGDPFEANYYPDFQEFLEKQSLKQLTHIVIREREQENLLSRCANSMEAKQLENMMELDVEFGKVNERRHSSLRERLIGYIKKYSLERLQIYVLVSNTYQYKLPDYHTPYITKVSDNVGSLAQHITTSDRRLKKNIKFRRLVTDLYRRLLVMVVGERDEAKESWETMFKEYKLSCDFYKDEEKLIKGLMSNYGEYILTSSVDMLARVIDTVKQMEIQTKLIYFGPESDLEQHHLRELWMVTNGRDRESQEAVGRNINRCTDVIEDETTQKSRNTVIYGGIKYTPRQQQLFLSEIKEGLKKAKKPMSQQQINKLNLRMVGGGDMEGVRDAIIETTFSYLITFDCPNPQIEKVKRWLVNNQFDSRVYVYSVQQNPESFQKIRKEKDEQKIEAYLKKRAVKVVDGAKFKIKKQIAPIESIYLYKYKSIENYLSNNMGLKTQNITGQDEFRKKYMKEYRLKMMESFHIVCHIKDYFTELKELLQSEKAPKDQKKEDPCEYLYKVKVILYDQKKNIEKTWSKVRPEMSREGHVAFVHYNVDRIEDYLDVVYIPVIKLSIFIKKALPNFFEAARKVERTNSRTFTLRGTIISKNSLIKEVFGDENFKLTVGYDMHFRQFPTSNRNAQFDVQLLQSEFLARYGLLWRPGYQICSSTDPQSIENLKHDIRSCLFICKSYEVLDVSYEEFEEFYLRRLQGCTTYLQLQICVIYMLSLPHGMTNIMEQIFGKPQQTYMTPRVFGAYVVTLLSAFCSFEDKVMGKIRLIVNMEDEQLGKKLGNMQPGDILFNTSFLFCGKDNSTKADQINSNSIVFEFEDIPMLSDTRIRNYLYIQRFSFYKQSTEYLIAPYTKFTVKSKVLTKNGYHRLTLLASSQIDKSFVSHVFKANNINEDIFFTVIKDETRRLRGGDKRDSKKERQGVVVNAPKHQELIDMEKTSSLYKKSELIGLYEQKQELLRSIYESIEYQHFMKDFRNQKYLSALSHIKKKEHINKNTTETEAFYYKKMLGLQKSLILSRMCEYDLSILELTKVQQFLKHEMHMDQVESWQYIKVHHFKTILKDLKSKRQKMLNRLPKRKKWRVEPQEVQGKRVAVKMHQRQYEWETKFVPEYEQFYLTMNKDKEENGKVISQEQQSFNIPYHVIQTYGESVTPFETDTGYKKISPQLLKKSFLQQRSNIKRISNLFNIKPQTAEMQQEPIQPSPERPISHSEPQSPISPHNFSLFNSTMNDPLVRTAQRTSPNFLPGAIGEIPQRQHENDQGKEPSVMKSTASQALTAFEQMLGVKEQVQWQSFYFQKGFVVASKGRHKKKKVPYKIK